MAIKMPPKSDLSTENQESDAWIKEGKKADDKAVDKKLRKQISVYLDLDTIQEAKTFCVQNDIRFNDFYELAILNQLKIERKE